MQFDECRLPRQGSLARPSGMTWLSEDEAGWRVVRWVALEHKVALGGEQSLATVSTLGPTPNDSAVPSLIGCADARQVRKKKSSEAAAGRRAATLSQCGPGRDARAQAYGPRLSGISHRLC